MLTNQLLVIGLIRYLIIIKIVKKLIFIDLRILKISIIVMVIFHFKIQIDSIFRKINHRTKYILNNSI